MFSSNLTALIFTICLTWCSCAYVDELQDLAGECIGEEQFPCMSGGCILQEQYCDGLVDCPDGSDEEFCLIHKADAEVCNVTHQFMCLDSQRCVPNSWLCNNETDCEDGSDELNCTATFNLQNNSTCKGYLCGDGKCISNLWVCDGVYDCPDKSDEYNMDLCRHVPHGIRDGSYCQEAPSIGERNYKCIDASYCLPPNMMCDGMKDCRDGSDEGAFCANWHTMCTNYTCHGNDTTCSPERSGPTCLCLPSMRSYNPRSGRCEDVDECQQERPQCSHACTNADGHFTCRCRGGYASDEYGYLCYARGPEAMLFFSTWNEIRYLKIKSKHMVTVATGLKKAHGVSFDGTYVYWVETAQGHQCIFKAQLDDVKDTKQVLVGLGLEDPGDITIDHLGGNLYFSDAARGVISACRADGSICTTLKTDSRHPKFLTLDANNGKMYWADLHHRPIIMSARMDGSQPDVLVEQLQSYATGLALDAPNERLYFVDRTVKVVMISRKVVYSLFEEPFHYPYSISVFENTVFWSDWTSNSIQTTDKLHSSAQKRNVLVTLDTHVLGMHMYHPVLMNASRNPCANNNCSHLCLVTSDTSHMCACPDTMETRQGRCQHPENYRAKYLIVGSGQLFTRIQYDTLGNPESHATHFDIGRVQAMAYDYKRDALYIFDSQRRTVNYINMSDFTLGVTHTLIYNDLDMVLDMDYDYVTDNLYLLDAGRRLIEVFSLSTQRRAHVYKFTDAERPISFCVLPDYGNRGYVTDNLYLLDAGRRLIEVFSLSTQRRAHVYKFTDAERPISFCVLPDYGNRGYMTDNLYLLDAGRRLVEVFSLSTQRRAHVYKFTDAERPISFCVLPDYGRMVVAVVESEQHNTIHVDNIALTGQDRRHAILNNLRGPHVRLRYVPHMDHVYLSDESNGVIDYFHPEGSWRENYRELATTVTSLSIADHYVFWTDRKTSRLYWSDLHEASHKIRRIDLALFPNNTQLLIQATYPIPDPKDPLLHHPCLNHVCSDVCIQQPKSTSDISSYKCLCPPGMLGWDGSCAKLVQCGDNEMMCHRSNTCVREHLRCDGVPDCPKGEDEEGCPEDPVNFICSLDEVFCNGKCVERSQPSSCNNQNNAAVKCDLATQYPCPNTTACVSRSQLCDGRADCPGGADELSALCAAPTCHHTDFMCTSGACIVKSWACDGDYDCNDGSDEVDCEYKTCKSGFYQCRDRECIELRRRCDGKQDCFDYSDEEDCEEPTVEQFLVEDMPKCAPWEYSCKHNDSICLPLTARCNMKIDCPGGTDEHGCDYRCAPHGLFACEQQLLCLPMLSVCNGRNDCVDGSDETPAACAKVNKTSYPFPQEECKEGYLCTSGQCLEWQQVCDGKPQCRDGSDEDGYCSTSCHNHTCSYKCQATPKGARCYCPPGFRLSPDRNSCLDIDECADDVCSQGCTNIPGSFICSCHYGYALRSNRRSCKAVQGNLSVLYVSGNTVRSVAADGYSSAVEFTDNKTPAITHLDYDVRASKLYVTSATAGKLLEVNSTKNVITVTNIGVPTRVAVDWVTGNVYFVDNQPNNKRIRVCHVRRKRCASLQKLPSDANVSALVVDPTSRRMFYCVTRQLESVVWSASLSGSRLADLSTVRNCTGLAVDPFKNTLYVAETGPAHIISMDYEGEKLKTILADNPQLQAPQGLAIFEDHIYYLIANSFHLSRCQLFGAKQCETYVYRVFGANTFVLRHQSVQRDDLTDDCEGYVCSNVCALDQDGPKCLCDDGSIAADGKCPVPDKRDLALFNGWTYPELESVHHVTLTVMSAVVVLVGVYIAFFIYYHFVHKPRRLRASAYTEVRFQNGQADTLPFHCDPTIQMSAAGGISHEFINPLQYVRNMWYSSFRKHTRPQVQAVSLNVPTSPPQQDLSDTESDLDDKEHKRMWFN